MTVGEFAERVLAYCLELNASEVAGYRTNLASDKLGAPSSDAHRAGLARDIVYDQIPSLASAITTAERLQLTVYRTNDHDHLEPKSWQDFIHGRNA